MFHLRNAAMAFALLVGISAAAAQTSTMDSKLQLTEAQKAQIYRTLASESAGAATKEARPSTPIKIGSTLPPATQLRDIPRSTVAQIPVLGRYKFAMLGDEVAIVEPSSRQVVDILNE